MQEGDIVLSSMSHLSYLEQPSSSLIKIPAGIAPEQAVFSIIAAIGLKGIRHADIKIGDSVLIAGLGLIGQCAQIFARLNGAAPVVGIDLSHARLEIAKKTGLFHALEGTDPDMDRKLKKIVPGGLFNTVIDASGTPHVIGTLPARTAEFGTIVILGGIHKKVTLDLYTFFQKNTQKMIGAGSPDPRTHPYDDKKVILRLISEGHVDFSPLITHRVSPEEAALIYKMLKENKESGMGVIFDWQRI